MFPGAGNVSRRWDLDKFAELAEKITADESNQTLVFLGPEETDLRESVEKTFPQNVKIIDKLALLEFVAALSKLAVLVSNDTGAIHLGAVVGTPIVVVMDERAPQTYLPPFEKVRVVNSATLDKISVDEVFRATREFLDE